ncbi:MAG: hypothetical protein R6W77_12705 [Trueperaceae bacterium]
MRTPRRPGVAAAALTLTAAAASVVLVAKVPDGKRPPWWPSIDSRSMSALSSAGQALRAAPAGAPRLKFTTVAWNDGDGPLEVRGAFDEAASVVHVAQYVLLENGEVVPGPPVGTFDFEHRHGHLRLSSL